MTDRPFSDFKNILNFGAKGDGIADDWDAIMRAFNWTNTTDRGTIFFPPGTYRVSQPIDFSGPDNGGTGTNFLVSFVGVGGLSTVVGDFPDYVFKRALIGTNGFDDGVHTIENLTVINNDPAGGGIRLGVCVGAAIRNCVVTANQALNTCSDDNRPDGTSLEVTVENCILSPGANVSGSMGIRSVSDGPISNCRIVGFETGMKLFGQEGSMSIENCWFELCGTGVSALAGVISGCVFKNCGTALNGGGNVKASGLRIEGATGTIAGDPQYGIKIAANSIGRSMFAGIVVTGAFQQYGIYFEGGESFSSFSTFFAVQSNNSAGLGNWRLPATAGTARFIGCNVAPVFTMPGLPAFPVAISSLAWSGGTTTLTESNANIGPYVNPAVTFDVTVIGASPSGYNGTFRGGASTGVVTATYPQADPGSPTGSGGTAIINPSLNAVPNSSEGDCYNVSDSDTAVWGASPIGGASGHAKVRWNGSNWAVMGV